MIFSALAVELKNLYQLQHTVGKFADHEGEKSQMVGIFERVNEARMRFEVCTILSAHIRKLIRCFQLETSIRLYSMVYAIEERLKVSVADAPDFLRRSLV